MYLMGVMTTWAFTSFAIGAEDVTIFRTHEGTNSARCHSGRRLVCSSFDFTDSSSEFAILSRLSTMSFTTPMDNFL